MRGWCAFKNHGSTVGKSCYKLFQHERGWIAYIEHFIDTIKYLIGDSDDVNHLLEATNILANPTLNSTPKNFKENLGRLIHFVELAEKEIAPKLSRMSCLECKRMGEAITCLQLSCFTASTVMAASAVEARLHYLISRKNKNIYNKHFKKASLGGLIKLFDENEYKKFMSLKSIVPARHHSLLDIVNTYRIFSAHPLGYELDRAIAETVINLSFLFLLDPELKIADKKALAHRHPKNRPSN